MICLLTTCKIGGEAHQEIYFNNFDTKDTTGIENAKFIQFNQSTVLGNYNNAGFTLNLHQLPSHDLVNISFTLYIHDIWDGNITEGGTSGPDIWEMDVNQAPYIYTTFSNHYCGNLFCDPQSYPDNYPNNNHNPKAGAFNKELPGLCSLSGFKDGTSAYHINKTIVHQSTDLTLHCLDHLIQTNTQDPLCYASWTIDSLKVSLIRLH